MGLFEHWPYTNFHDLNLDWIIKKLPEVFTASAQAVQSAETAVSAKDDAVAAKEDAQSSAENAALSEENAERSAESAQDYAEHIADPVGGLVTTWLDDNIMPTTPPIDRSLSVQDAAADAKATGDAIDALQAQLNNAMPIEVRQALDRIIQNVAFENNFGYDTELTLFHVWASSVSLVSITAVFNQGLNQIYDTDSLDTLRQYLTVNANYDNGTSVPVTTYTLSGTLAEGVSTITAAYGGETTTFNVDVTDGWYWDYSMGLPTAKGATMLTPENLSVFENTALGVRMKAGTANGNGRVLVPSAYQGKPTIYTVEYDLTPVNFGATSGSYVGWAGIVLTNGDSLNNKYNYVCMKADGLYLSGTKTEDYTLNTGTEYIIRETNNILYVDNNQVGAINTNTSTHAPECGVGVATTDAEIYLKSIRVYKTS